MEELILTEAEIVNRVKNFLVNKKNGNWHEEKSHIAKTHEHGPDIVMVGGKLNGERFIIECKKKMEY